MCGLSFRKIYLVRVKINLKRIALSVDKGNYDGIIQAMNSSGLILWWRLLVSSCVSNIS